MIKIEIESPDQMLDDLRGTLRILRESGAPVEFRYAIDALITDIRKAKRSLIAGETL